MVVLAVCSLASAGFVFTAGDGFNPNGSINAGVVGTVNVLVDADLISAWSIGGISVDAGTLTIGTVNALAAKGISSPGDQKDGSESGIFIFQAKGTLDVGVPLVADSVLYSFTVNTAGLADGTIITINDVTTGTNPFGMPPFPMTTTVDGATADMGAMSFSVVPEPLTLGLLGLGGLFLRRRK